MRFFHDKTRCDKQQRQRAPEKGKNAENYFDGMASTGSSIHIGLNRITFIESRIFNVEPEQDGERERDSDFHVIEKLTKKKKRNKSIVSDLGLGICNRIGYVDRRFMSFPHFTETHTNERTHTQTTIKLNNPINDCQWSRK